MYSSTIKFILLTVLWSSTAEKEQERTLSNVGLPFLSQYLLQPSLLGGADKTPTLPSFFQQLIPQSSKQQVENFVSLVQNISQSFYKPQSSQQNETTNSTKSELSGPIFSIPPVFTTLPFHNLSNVELSWFLENEQKGNNSGANSNQQKSVKLFGNSGRNVTYGDLNFLTVPQLLNIFGR